ncbi:kinase-like protein [Hypoxylon sp. FL1284]|nr:kinase-like protein [Hypoxylon sp. FL1284]
MASLSYDEMVRDLYSQIHRKLERQDVADQRFARTGTAEEVLAPFNLGRFFSSLPPPGHSLGDYFSSRVTEDSLISRIEERSLQTFLAILIYARCSVGSARNFVTKLLIPSEPIAAELPADREQLEHILGVENEPDINSFMDTQSCFCPIVLYEGEDVQVADGKRRRLPYVRDEKYIDTGSYGIVYHVVIAKGHLANRHAPGHMKNTQDIPMARKDFKKVHELHKEYEIMKHILRAPRKSRNIVETFGSLQLGETTFSLFMPLAECDLRVWMRNNEPPIFEWQKADILSCASGLADGLEFLHSEIRDSTGNQMVCYHMDLKPANILVFLDDRERGRMVWKISDFGMSRVKLSHRGEQDLTTLFEKRDGGTSASGTMNRRFEATYLAPESSISLRNMNEKSDVWSLGCLISVLLTYLGAGQAGIDKYSDDRATISQRSGAGNMDRFFLIGRSSTQLRPHPAIGKHHKQLIVEANERSSGEGKVMTNVVRFIDGEVLQLEPRRRVSAGSIRATLLSASAAYQKLSDRDTSSDNSSSVEINLDLAWWQRPFRRKQIVKGPRVEDWEINDAGPATGCSIAPNGFIIAYWRGAKISLYNSHSFLPHSGRPINMIAEEEIKGAGSLKSAKLTDRYLIASTAGHHCHAYLFDLKGGGQPGLGFGQGYEVLLPISNPNGLYQIAISPGSKVLACVVYRDTDSAWVFYANVQRLLDQGTRRRDSENTLSSNGGPRYPRIVAPEQWNRFRMDASAGSITHLSFTSDTTLCCVAQPDISERHPPHIACLSIPDKLVKPYHLANSSDVEFDSGNWGRLFTTLTTTDSEHTLAVVLYQNQLIIRNFVNPSPHLSSQTTFRNYFILKLLMDRQHSRLYALGSKFGHGKLLLMELPLERLSHREKPREIKQFPHIDHRDKFTAELIRGVGPLLGEASGEPYRTDVTDADTEGYIIISVYSRARPRLYKMNLPSMRGE